MATELVLGPQAARPLRLRIPIFVSDMSFGVLSEEAKVALARGAEQAGAGGHFPGIKITARIAALRGVSVGEPVISPSTFTDLSTVDDFRRFADRVRKISGGIPVGFKISAQHIEADLDFAIDAGADYIILDGRGGGAGPAAG